MQDERKSGRVSMAKVFEGYMIAALIVQVMADSRLYVVVELLDVDSRLVSAVDRARWAGQVGRL